MATLSDQSFAASTWVTVAGLTNGISYILQNKSDFKNLFVFESSSLPTELAGKGELVELFEIYEFVKGADDINIFSPDKDGLISVRSV